VTPTEASPARRIQRAERVASRAALRPASNSPRPGPASSPGARAAARVSRHRWQKRGGQAGAGVDRKVACGFRRPAAARSRCASLGAGGRDHHALEAACPSARVEASRPRLRCARAQGHTREVGVRSRAASGRPARSSFTWLPGREVRDAISRPDVVVADHQQGGRQAVSLRGRGWVSPPASRREGNGH